MVFKQLSQIAWLRNAWSISTAGWISYICLRKQRCGLNQWSHVLISAAALVCRRWCQYMGEQLPSTVLQGCNNSYLPVPMLPWLIFFWKRLLLLRTWVWYCSPLNQLYCYVLFSDTHFTYNYKNDLNKHSISVPHGAYKHDITPQQICVGMWVVILNRPHGLISYSMENVCQYWTGYGGSTLIFQNKIYIYQDSKARWAHVGPTRSRQDPRWANEV